MSFTYDPTTQIGLIRLRLADTVEAYAFLSDEEIQAQITDTGSTNGATVACARSILALLARRVRRVGDKDKSYDDTKQIDAMKCVIEQYGGTSLPTVQVSGPSSLPSDADYCVSVS